MIGKHLYYYDLNAKRYSDSYFVPVLITEETKQSWIGHRDGKRVTFNKKTLEVGMANKGGAINDRGFTEEMMNNQIWKDTHLIEIEKALRSISADKLRRVYEIIHES